ncbi:hypothetical protein BH10ACT7_BH10ACT7_29000 [soil metagenome]
MYVARTAAVAAIALLALTGCSPDRADAEGDPSAAPTDAANPTDSPTPEPAKPTMPAFTDQEVIVISAQATAPNGAVLDVKMTTYYPVAADSPEAAQIQDYLAFVGSGSEVADPDFTDAKNAIIQVSKLTATAVSGVWPGNAGVLPSLGPGVTDTIVDIPAGPIAGNRLSLTGAGNGYGVAAIYSQDGSKTDVTQWAARFAYYGFNDAFAGSTLSGCSIQIAPLGATSAGIGAFTQHNCFVGAGD